MWRDLPQNIDPVAFALGPIAVHWYALMWLCAFGVTYGITLYRKKLGEIDLRIDQISDVLSTALIGALIGGRLGYVLFYDLVFFLEHPLRIIVPWDASVGWVGISGMSYHGGVIGVVCALYLYARKHHLSVLQLVDAFIPAASLGYVFGRIGNFLGSELVGRETVIPWAVDFGDGVLRHPSQLYEAFGEGILIFVVLWFVRKRFLVPGMLGALYITLYGAVRFFIEFFRAPDVHIGFIWGFLTRGQIFSACMFLVGCLLLYFLQKKSRSLSM